MSFGKYSEPNKLSKVVILPPLKFDLPLSNLLIELLAFLASAIPNFLIVFNEYPVPNVEYNVLLYILYINSIYDPWYINI